MADASSRGKRIIASHDGKVRFEAQNNRLISSDGTNDRFVVGTRSDGSVGPFLSKPGDDVKDAAAAELIINSGQNVFKITNDDGDTVDLSVGFTDFPLPLAASSSNNFTMNSITFVHGLGFVPQVVLSRPGQSAGQYTTAAPGIQDIWMDGHGAGASGLVIAFTRLYVNVTTSQIDFVLLGKWSNSSTSTYVLPPFISGMLYKFYLLQETAN